MRSLIGLALVLHASACGSSPTAVDAPTTVVIEELEAVSAPESSSDPVDSERQSIERVMQSSDGWDARRILKVEVTDGDGGELVILGEARDASDIAQLVQRTQRAGIFTAITVRKTNAARGGNATAFILSMRCNGARHCAATDVQRIWRAAIDANPKERPKPKRSFPTLSSLRLVATIPSGSKAVRAAVLLIEQSGLGWTVKEGEVRGGNELVHVGTTHAVFRSVADGSEQTLQIANKP